VTKDDLPRVVVKLKVRDRRAENFESVSDSASESRHGRDELQGLWRDNILTRRDKMSREE